MIESLDENIRAQNPDAYALSDVAILLPIELQKHCYLHEQLALFDAHEDYFRQTLDGRAFRAYSSALALLVQRCPRERVEALPLVARRIYDARAGRTGVSR